MDIEESSQKFQNYKIDVDTRKAEIMTLETQIQNMQGAADKKSKVTKSI